MASKVTFNGELLFPNDYLNAAEFKGRDVALTISAITREMLQKKGGKDKKETVFRFNGTAKKFVCNKTNADTIATMYGTKAETWVGKKVVLYPTRCLAFGEMVDCIRVRNGNGTAHPPAAPPVQNEPSPFPDDALADGFDAAEPQKDDDAAGGAPKSEAAGGAAAAADDKAAADFGSFTMALAELAEKQTVDSKITGALVNQLKIGDCGSAKRSVGIPARKKILAAAKAGVLKWEDGTYPTD